MRPQLRLVTTIILAALGGGIVWLLFQMSRTDRSDRWLVALAAAAGVAALAIVVGLRRRTR